LSVESFDDDLSRFEADGAASLPASPKSYFTRALTRRAMYVVGAADNASARSSATCRRAKLKAPPAGTLKEWHWRALAKAYAAGDEGLEGEYGVYAHIGERTWQRLLEYKRGALVEERGTVIDVLTGRIHRMHITANGRAPYHDQWARYRPVDCTNVC
jgi:hypothetical protein